MVRRIIGSDPIRCLFGGVDDSVESEVLRGDEAAGEQLVPDEPVPRLPISFAGKLHEYDRHRRRLPGLQEREDLETLVVRPESAGEQGDRIGLHDEEDLAGEEVAEVDHLRIVLDHPGRALLEGQEDVDAEGVLRARALDPRAHDALRGAGDHHESLADKWPPEPHREVVVGMALLLPGRPEDRDFADASVRLEDARGVPELRHRPVDDLEVEDVELVPLRLQRVQEDVAVQDGPQVLLIRSQDLFGESKGLLPLLPLIALAPLLLTPLGFHGPPHVQRSSRTSLQTPMKAEPRSLGMLVPSAESFPQSRHRTRKPGWEYI